jgi:hypothetical protein
MTVYDFVISLYKSKNIVNLYKSVGAMVRYSDYSLTEIENMIPYEFDIYSSILMEQIQEEKKKK